MKKTSARKIKKFFKEHALIIALTLIFVIIKISFIFKFHSVIWDEAVYLGIGKYIYSLGKLGFWEIERPILLSLIIGFFWKLNLPYVLLSEVLIISFSAASLVLVYIIGKESFNKMVGFFASLFLALTSIFFLYSNYILTGIASTFFILLAIYCYIKYNNLILAGIFSAVGALFRFPQGLILICFILFFFIDDLIKKKNPKDFIKKSFIYSLFFALANIPFIILNYILYNKETSKIYHALFRPWLLNLWAQSNPAEAVLTSTISSQIYNILFYILNMFKENTLLIFIFFGLFFLFKQKKFNDSKKKILLIILIVYFAYFTFILNKQVRFLLVFLPYICIFSAYGFYHLFKISKKKDRYRVILILFLLISSFGLASKNLSYYSWRLPNENDITREYYKFFVGKEIKGPILTSDPVQVAYVDAEFIPFYFSVDVAWSIYNKNKNSSYAIIYSPESFFCSDDDKECKKKLDLMTKTIDKENSLIFSKIYADRVYYIYEVI